MWIKAEEHFPAIREARENGTSVMIKLLGNVHLMSNIWGGLQKRYTGVHSIDVEGRVMPMTGVNLEDHEWDVVMENFSKIKDLLKGKNVEFAGIKRTHDFDTTVKMYVMKWFLNGKEIDTGVEKIEWFTEDEANRDTLRTEPKLGKHYETGGDTPSCVIETVRRPVPEETLLMYLVLLCCVERKMEEERQMNCTACHIDSGSQYDHFSPGNCLDDTFDFIDLNIEKVKNKIKVHNLKTIFDKVLRNIEAPPIFSRLMAKCALEYIESDTIVRELKSQTTLKANKALVNTIKWAWNDLSLIE